MRLAQLARKLGVKPADVQAFLTTGDQNLELNTNARLTDEQVVVAVRHFDPALEATIFQEPAQGEPAADGDRGEQPTVDSDLAKPVSGSPEQIEQVSVPTFENTVDESGPETEVIRAPKLELPGLKVVGKIELKEPKKKTEVEGDPPQEATPVGDGDTIPQREPRQERPPRPVRRQAPPRQWKNPLEAQRQHEAREREEQRARELELKKEQRTQKYLRKVKSVPTKPVRRREEEVVEIQEDTRPMPKTWLGKFARWLTT
jgi:hypothetical protein